MALPTLQPYYFSRGKAAHQERLIVRRRTHEDDRRQQWNEHSRYFSSSSVLSCKQEGWTSSKSFQDSMDAYHSRGREEERRKRLQERREELRRLLKEETENLQRELEELSADSMSQMKSRADYLKSRREAERERVAAEKIHEHWQANCPELRQVESRELEKAVHKEWGQQLQYRQQELQSARKETESYDEAVKLERLAALRLEEEESERRKENEREHAQALQRQMAEIKAREEEAAILQHQHALLLQEQVEIEEAEEERKQLEQQQKGTEFGRLLIRQAKAQLRRKSRQIQEALELDLRILEDLARKEKDEQALHTTRRKKAKADAEWMRKVVAEQLKLEKGREAELDLLYQEEAARMWQKREAEWERERVAREKLMAEVLAERQHQIQDQMEVVEARQAESIQQREELLGKMEVESQMTARETKQQQRAQSQRTKELEAQVTERRRKAEEARLQYERELEEQRIAEEEYKCLVRDEEQRMTARGYQSKAHVKRKYAWY